MIKELLYQDKSIQDLQYILDGIAAQIRELEKEYQTVYNVLNTKLNDLSPKEGYYAQNNREQ